MADRTNAERQRRYIARLKAAAADNKPGPSASARKAAYDVPWEIMVDDEGEGYLAAYMEPYGLYVRQIGDEFSWDIMRDVDENKEPIGVADGWAPTLLAATLAATHHWATVHKAAKQR
jgi:hypothetical protein